MSDQGLLLVCCDRCGTPLRLGEPPNPDARLVRRAEIPKGVCANCSLTAFLKTLEPLATVLAAKGPETLSVPAVQEQVARMMVAGKADARPGEINFDVIVKQWDLPLNGSAER